MTTHLIGASGIEYANNDSHHYQAEPLQGLAQRAFNMPQLNATGTLALIVEDDPDTRALEKVILEDAGFVVLTAKNGEDGIRFATDRHPSVILLDLALPTASGFDVLKNLKSSPVTANIPVVLISAYVMLVDNCLARGASAYVQKPFDVDDLVAQVKHALKVAVDLKPIALATYT